MDLFGKTVKNEKFSKIFESVDKLSTKFGKHTVFLGSSFQAMNQQNTRATPSPRATDRLRGETTRQHLAIPMLRTIN